MGDSVAAAQFLALLDQMSVLVFIAAVLFIIYLITRYRSSRTSDRAPRNHLVQENPSIVAMPVAKLQPQFSYRLY